MDNTKMLSDEMSYNLADFFKLFGDATRIKILYALYQGEMNVSDVVILANKVMG